MLCLSTVFSANIVYSLHFFSKEEAKQIPKHIIAIKLILFSCVSSMIYFYLI